MLLSICGYIEGRERVGRGSGEGRERVGRGSGEGRQRIGRGSGEGRERVGRGSGEGRERIGRGSIIQYNRSIIYTITNNRSIYIQYNRSIDIHNTYNNTQLLQALKVRSHFGSSHFGSSAYFRLPASIPKHDDHMERRWPRGCTAGPHLLGQVQDEKAQEPTLQIYSSSNW